MEKVVYLSIDLPDRHPVSTPKNHPEKPCKKKVSVTKVLDSYYISEIIRENNSEVILSENPKQVGNELDLNLSRSLAEFGSETHWTQQRYGMSRNRKDNRIEMEKIETAFECLPLKKESSKFNQPNYGKDYNRNTYQELAKKEDKKDNMNNNTELNKVDNNDNETIDDKKNYEIDKAHIKKNEKIKESGIKATKDSIDSTSDEEDNLKLVEVEKAMALKEKKQRTYLLELWKMLWIMRPWMTDCKMSVEEEDYEVERLAEKKNLDYVGFCYQNGIVAKRDKKKMLESYLRPAKDKDPNIQDYLGNKSFAIIRLENTCKNWTQKVNACWCGIMGELSNSRKKEFRPEQVLTFNAATGRVVKESVKIKSN
ncbi:2064_t:CDS:2 [Gigaspora margarita]|uniref:2064_t:CDS:1 n=1 Tax=Gigaspora margarita TaxID=4874 RepID=A0ABN7UBF5_GIGMA|nr:2064_t:CDS:2 [Gigaspora margarita]